MKDFQEYLKPTEFLDFDKKRVRKKAMNIVKGKQSDKEKAVVLFYWVRDRIKYNMYTYIPQYKTNLKASTTLRRENGFCMSKAVLLTTLARAVKIPARIHMVDIVNHKAPDWVVDFMGSKNFHCHGYSEMYINKQWVKATPVFDKNTCKKAGYPIVEFDGIHNAMLPKYDQNGTLFVEYIDDWGVYDDVPIKKIQEIFEDKYGSIYTDLKFQKLKRK
jgi:transglutaminase-like putative cysteine protease